MKSIRLHTLSIALLALVATLASSLADGRRFILGISATLPAAERQDAWAATVDFIALKMSPGDRLDAYDASALQPIATIEIPNEPLFSSAKPRLNRFAPQFAKMKAFFAHDSAGPNPAAGAAMVPQFLDFAGRQLRTRSDEPLIIVVLAAPWYADAEQAFDFGPEGAYPSDGFFRLPAAESPFSTTEKANVLKGITIHWSWLRNEGRWLSDAHRQGVVRFWHLFVTTQGGVLNSAEASAKDIFARAAQGIASPLLNATPDPAAKAEMILIRRLRSEAPPAAATVTAAGQSAVVPEAPPEWLNRNALPAPTTPPRPRARVKLGIRWGDNDPSAQPIDIDVYVLARPGVKELSFRRTRTSEGRLWKDWLTSPSVANGYETVELEGETDLTHLAIAVNFYAGNHPGGMEVALRIWVDGTVYECQIHIVASEGNQGAASDHRASDPHWVVVDVQKAVGLRQ